jgi:5'-3' exonuclease
LSNYKKPARLAMQEKKAEDREMKKRIAKERQRLIGRVIPTKLEYEAERELQIVATRGVIQLFNAVSEFQSQAQKQVLKDEHVKTSKRTAMI